MSERFFAPADFSEFRIAVHQIFDDKRALDGKLPIRVDLRGSFLRFFRIFIESRRTIFARPFERALVFVFVVDLFFDAAIHFDFIDGLYAHTEIFFKKIGIDLRTGYPHARRSDLQIGFTAHRRCGYGCFSETYQFFFYVVGDRFVVEFLYGAAVDAERGKAFARVAGEHACKVYGARAFRRV